MKEIKRYESKSWVCDKGIWDNLKGNFIGKPFNSGVECDNFVRILNDNDFKIKKEKISFIESIKIWNKKHE